MSSKPILVLIQSTDSPVQMHLDKGIWERQRFTLTQYASVFQVYYYTCDKESMQSYMPQGVVHKSPAVASSMFGLRHMLYYVFLCLSAFKWRKLKDVVIRVIGVNVPVIPLAKRASRKRMVISYQFDWARGMRLDYKGIKPMVSNQVQAGVVGAADHLICTTQWLKDIAMTRYNVPESRITIIPNYVNTGVFAPQLPKKKQVAFAGRLHWSKGIDTLINAFNQFSKRKPGYTLVVMGNGEEEAALRAMVDEGVAVNFTGAVPNSEVARVFNESEIFVLPSVNMEGHPKALVEAMAAGCKCIVSDVRGNNNVLQESASTELLFPSQDASTLFEKLVYASENSVDQQFHFAVTNYAHTVLFEKELGILRSYIS